MLKLDRFSCSQKIRLKRDPPVLEFFILLLLFMHIYTALLIMTGVIYTFTWLYYAQALILYLYLHGLLGLSYKWKNLWCKAWNIKCVQNWQMYLPGRSASGSEWHFQIFTVQAHIGRWSGRSTPQYWHLVVKNGNFTFLLLQLILADEVADVLADPSPSATI